MKKSDISTYPTFNDYLKSDDMKPYAVHQNHRVPFQTSPYSYSLSVSRKTNENESTSLEHRSMDSMIDKSKYLNENLPKDNSEYTFALEDDDFFFNDSIENCSDSFSCGYYDDDIEKGNDDTDGDQSTIISFSEHNAILERNREELEEEIDGAKPESLDLKSENTTDSTADDDSAYSEGCSIPFHTTRSCLVDYKNSDKRDDYRKCPRVRFADALGLELENIRYLTPPKEILTPMMVSNALSEKIQIFYTSHKNRKALTPLYEQPNTSAHFIDNVTRNIVLLEYAFSNRLSLFGSVRVKNIEYEKHIFVRYSPNEWKTYSDIEATFSHHHADNDTDSFSFYCDFTIWSHGLRRIEFAVYYKNSRGECIWDNNNGKNYTLVCKYS